MQNPTTAFTTMVKINRIKLKTHKHERHSLNENIIRLFTNTNLSPNTNHLVFSVY